MNLREATLMLIYLHIAKQVSTVRLTNCIYNIKLGKNLFINRPEFIRNISKLSQTYLNMADTVANTAKPAESKPKLTAREEQNLKNQQLLNTSVTDFSTDKFGYVPFRFNKAPSREFLEIKDLDDHVSEYVWLRGRVHELRGKGALCFLVLRQQRELLQCVIDSKSEENTKDMVKWASSLSFESVVDVYGKVVVPNSPILSTTSANELHVSKVFCLSKSSPNLPFLLRDANNTDNEEMMENPSVIRVNQDTRLDNRALDLRCFLNGVIFKIQSQVCQLYREFLLSKDFIEIHTPKLLGGSSEGGSSVFKFKYFDQDACLAQSPQLYKQMAICGDLKRVFEIGPVFRAENSNTHRHLCEYVGLDLEMEFKNDYMEVVDLIDEMLKHVFEGLSKKSGSELDYFYKCNPSITRFKFIEKTPKLSFQEAADMLRSSEVAEEIPEDLNDYDFSTEHEKLLGKLVRERYGTDYYIVYDYPLNARPFYTMPKYEDDAGAGSSSNEDGSAAVLNGTEEGAKPLKLSRSYDFFMRGEEILSGAQRIHDSAELERRARECGLDVNTIRDYVDVFKYGAFPHAGSGIGLERVVMLFLGLGNVRRTSMFPRDPKRLTP
ncbi:aspartyl-tRNA synthetase [Theileria orientalis strain Shintoku]|uniref:aspartate--tRNA ligase n=1 Tax=Theileria orientalis strain Shintoku TaxID=869250 RepID=J4DPQ2_THEOR|nr:aspartyl-tRNA synthetase [Theileria orientalis strain Shintoku]BAM41099.1 aspartyl-tRNA synthetase [Theileria orientalis strain Shintoku]|eukprot:XP_009691400.1 aspartyl-tRNA synthetase [Theileria orientalis strain Shintoku]